MLHKSAIVGFGGMGRNHHFQRVSAQIPDIQVVGAWDIREERREIAQADGLRVYGSLAECLADPETDIIVVATPNDIHKELVIQALEAGKNVICEKPVTMNADELTEIIAVRDKTGKQFAVHQNRRWDRNFRIAKMAYDAGTLGKPFYIEHRVQGTGGTLYGWRAAKVNGGGMLLDWGVHFIDQIMWMVDSPVRDVYVQMFKINSNECDDNIKIHFNFENGIAAMVQVDTWCFIPEPLWHITGSEATLVINDWDCNGRIVRSMPDLDPEWTENIIYTKMGPTRTMAPRSPKSMKELPLPDAGPDNDYAAFYRNYLAALEGKEDLIVKPEQSLRVMKLIDAAFLSWEEGRSVQGPF